MFINFKIENPEDLDEFFTNLKEMSKADIKGLDTFLFHGKYRDIFPRNVQILLMI